MRDNLISQDALDAMSRHAESLANQPTVEVSSEGDPNCLSHWFPLIEKAGVPVPKTTILRTKLNLLNFVEPGEEVDFAPFIKFANDVSAACDAMGYPCFLRTGQGSGKHEWSRCCFVESGDKIQQHIGNLVVWSNIVDMLGLLTDVWVVRELLPTRPLFRCTRYCDFPVVREYRFFVDGDRVAYWQPYWPKDALEQGKPDKDNWRGFLSYLNAKPHQDCFEMASICGDACGGRWSVDILETDRGWFVTDMAVAERSWGFDERKM